MKNIKNLFSLPMKLIVPLLLISLFAACGGSGSEPATTVQPPQIVTPPPAVKRDFLWPLCGHITSNPPSGWQDADGCPDNRWNEDFSDFPISSTYSPRQKASENFRYDFHRGIDIPTVFGTPVFAVKAGTVTRAGEHDQFSDLGVTIQHYDASVNCDVSDCLHSLYIHLSRVSVTLDQEITKGQLLGFSGDTDQGIEHLHFEIRKSPGEFDRYSAWQRDAVHPLSVLPINETALDDDYVIDFSNLILINGNELSLDTNITSRNISTVAFTRLDLQVYAKQTDSSFVLLEQANDLPQGNTPDGQGYYLNPSWYDIELLSQQYSYKDSSLFPWTAFEFGGDYESPYANILPNTYSPNFHLDNPSFADPRVGEFNGKSITPAEMSTNSSNYQMRLRFTELNSPSELTNVCLKARAIDARGKATKWYEYQCN